MSNNLGLSCAKKLKPNCTELKELPKSIFCLKFNGNKFALQKICLTKWGKKFQGMNLICWRTNQLGPLWYSQPNTTHIRGTHLKKKNCPPHLLIFSLECQTKISEILSRFVNFLTHRQASQYSEIDHFGSNAPFWNGNCSFFLLNTENLFIWA